MTILNLPGLSDLLVIAMTIGGEGLSESWSGKILIADTIFNYAQEHNLTIRQSCLLRKPDRYSCWNQPSNVIFKTAGYVNQPKSARAWRDCVEIASILDTGTYRPTSRATHYANLDLCNPRWIKNMEKLGKIGKHTFYVDKTQ